jgi:hypothetical protein
MKDHKAHQSTVHKQKYEQQKYKTDKNKKKHIAAQARFVAKKKAEQEGDNGQA